MTKNVLMPQKCPHFTSRMWILVLKVQHICTHRAINYTVLSKSCPSSFMCSIALRYIVSFYTVLSSLFLFQHIIYFLNTVSSSNEQFFPSLTLLEKAVKQLLSGLVQCCHLLAVISCYSCTNWWRVEIYLSRAWFPVRTASITLHLREFTLPLSFIYRDFNGAQPVLERRSGSN